MHLCRCLPSVDRCLKLHTDTYTDASLSINVQVLAASTQSQARSQCKVCCLKEAHQLLQLCLLKRAPHEMRQHHARASVNLSFQMIKECRHLQISSNCRHASSPWSECTGNMRPGMRNLDLTPLSNADWAESHRLNHWGAW